MKRIGRKFTSLTVEFLRLEAAGGIVLVFAAILAMLAANSGFVGSYNYIFDNLHGRHWINDGLMAIFFFVVGLEIKREIVEGELSSKRRALLPTLAAIGGMVVPAGLFLAFNHSYPENIRGWAIPSATDIAFSLGVLSLLGRRVPLNLKILLTAIAVIDDLGAILIIAVAYSQGINFLAMGAAFVAVAVLFAMNRMKVQSLVPYLIMGLLLWVAVLNSGVHATLAGVATALFIPIRTKDQREPCADLIHVLHPWVAFGILPLFAFANAGVPLAGMGLSDLFHPLTLGIASGLFFGKQIGIFLMLALAILLRWCPKPGEVRWHQLYGVSLLCGIGFTMSLFIGELAYDGVEFQAHVRMGVIMGSLLSAVAGYLVLRFWPARRQ